MNTITCLYDLTQDLLDLGGPGSGNWGHAGRPGKIGGSAPRTGGGGEKVVHGSISARDDGLPAGYTPAARTVDYYEAWELLKTASSETSQVSTAARLAAVAHEIGFDGPPSVITKDEMDALIASGDYIELHRGITATNEKTGAQLREEFRTGPCFYGTGFGADGIYTSSALPYSEDWRTVGKAAGYTSMNDHAVLRMALSRKARTIEYVDAGMYSEDAGNWAVRHGYDAVRMDRDFGNDRAGNVIWVLLNRTAVFVQDTDMSTDFPKK